MTHEGSRALFRTRTFASPVVLVWLLAVPSAVTSGQEGAAQYFTGGHSPPVELTAIEEVATDARPGSSVAPDPALQHVYRRAEQQVAYGFDLASRGATYSARAQFLAALTTVADALDTAAGTRTHRTALAAGLQALREAEDFQPAQIGLAGSFELIVAAHRTPVLKQQDVSQLTSFAAMQQYGRYAHEQLVAAVPGVPVASAALYGLARLSAFQQAQPHVRQPLGEAKAVILHQAALAVDPQNYRAANELGVLLARIGHLEPARAAFHQSLAAQPSPAAWYNLGLVCQKLGAVDEARHALAQYQSASGHGNGSASDSRLLVRWVDHEEFARHSSASGSEADEEALPASNVTEDVPNQPATTPSEDWFRLFTGPSR